MRPYKRLYFDNIQLVPVDRRDERYKNRPDSWHLPGGEIVTTKELVKRAEARDIALVLHEFDGENQRVTSLI